MSETPTMVVLHKAGKWYCKRPGYSQYWDADRFRIDGRAVNVCVDKSWCWVEFQPECVEELVYPAQKIIGYDRLPEFSALNIEVPLSVDAEYFGYLADFETRKNAEFYPFYEPRYDKPEPFWRVCQYAIVVASLDAEPCRFKFAVRVAPPASFAEYPEVHHLFPCSASSESVFNYAYDKIAAVVEGAKNLRRDNYRSIGCLSVERRFRWATPKTKRRDISRLGSRKPRYEPYTESEIWQKIINIQVAGKTYQDETVPSFSADNYPALEQQVDDYVQSLLDRLSDVLIEECSECAGRGWREKP